MRQYIGVILFLVLPGFFALIYNLWSLKGEGRKSLYMADHIYAGRAYIGIPLGIAALFLALAAPFEPDSVIGWILACTGLGIGVLGLIFAFIQPSFLKPTWLKWLEREHGEIMPLLRQEVAEMGHSAWSKQMQTQADMEAWVAEVRAKHGL